MRREGAVLEFLEVAGSKKEQTFVQWGKDIAAQLCIKVVNVHVGEVLHGQEHLCLNMWNLYSLQSTVINRNCPRGTRMSVCQKEC